MQLVVIKAQLFGHPLLFSVQLTPIIFCMDNYSVYTHTIMSFADVNYCNMNPIGCSRGKSCKREKAGIFKCM